MKRILLSLSCLVLATGVALAGTIRVECSDSKPHTVELSCSGSKKTLEIRPNVTTSYTFHSSAKSCDIIGGTIKFPTNKLEDGQKWKIKDGVAKPN
jgi:spore coat protein U-like protein